MSDLRTKPIRDLVDAVLPSVPHTAHVIDEVFYAIEHSPKWRRDYEDLCIEWKGADQVHQWVARWTKGRLGWATEGEVDARKNTLTKNYSILIPDSRQLTIEERRDRAGDEVLKFFKRFEQVLDRKRVVPLRDELTRRVLEGVPVEEAYLAVMAEHGLDVKPLENEIAQPCATR